METYFDQLIFFLTTYGLKIIGAIIILIVGRIAAGIGRRIIRNMLVKSNTDASIVSFTESLVYFAIIAFAVLAALAKFGIQTASFVAVLGAAVALSDSIGRSPLRANKRLAVDQASGDNCKSARRPT